MGPQPLLVALLAGALAAPVSAQSEGTGRSLEIVDFHAELVVHPDGGLDVREIVRFRFDGRWNGVYRTIPVDYRTPQGFGKHLLLDVTGVTDEAGVPLEYEQGREGHDRKIQVWVPDAEDVERTVVFRYRSPNALLFFDTHDELYWNVTGDEWAIPIRRASALVRLPPGASGLRATAYTGPFGSTAQDAEWSRTPDGFAFETTEPLGFREGLTAVVGWDPGVVDRPGLAARAGWFLRANFLLLLPLLTAGVMYAVWRRHGRDPKRRAIVPRYEPPEGLTPAEMGTLVDHSPDPRDLTATLVDLAVRGHLRIEEVEETGLARFFGSGTYRLHARTGPEAWRELVEHERRLMEGVFEDGERTETTLSALDQAFYTHLPAIRTAIFRRLKEDGHYVRLPRQVAGVWMAVAFGTGFASVAFGLAVSEALALPELTAVVAGVLAAVPVVGFGLLMPARTVRGTRKLEEILGFQEFLERVESDRFRRVIDSPALFERYLPHAMALGVEQRWARAFEGMALEPPEWYTGDRGPAFRSTSFANDLGTWSQRAGSAMTSAPRSSGGSGFSGGGGGGGSSGGGSGGGGGGGF